VNTLLQTAKFGTPLAQSLRVLAAEFREARMTRAEAKAARLPAMLTVPMIVFILPTLFIVVLGPAVLGVMDTFSGKKAQEGNDKGANSSAGPAAAANGSTTAVREQAATQGVTLAVVKDPVRLIDPVIVDIDARSLRSGFQHRLAVVPADTPDKVQDAAAFARDTVAAQPARTRAFLSARSAGANEVRLYYIPQFGSEFVIAGRAKLTVQPGAPGAIEASQVLREAGRSASPVSRTPIAAAAWLFRASSCGSSSTAPTSSARPSRLRAARWIRARPMPRCLSAGTSRCPTSMARRANWSACCRWMTRRSKRGSWPSANRCWCAARRRPGAW
jgi:hypothetical protein